MHKPMPMHKPKLPMHFHLRLHLLLSLIFLFLLLLHPTNQDNPTNQAIHPSCRPTEEKEEARRAKKVFVVARINAHPEEPDPDPDEPDPNSDEVPPLLKFTLKYFHCCI